MRKVYLVLGIVALFLVPIVMGNIESSAEKAGEILGTEITPMLVGGYLGFRFWKYLSGKYKKKDKRAGRVLETCPVS